MAALVTLLVSALLVATSCTSDPVSTARVIVPSPTTRFTETVYVVGPPVIETPVCPTDPVSVITRSESRLKFCTGSLKVTVKLMVELFVGLAVVTRIVSHVGAAASTPTHIMLKRRLLRKAILTNRMLPIDVPDLGQLSVPAFAHDTMPSSYVPMPSSNKT